MPPRFSLRGQVSVSRAGTVKGGELAQTFPYGQEPAILSAIRARECVEASAVEPASQRDGKLDVTGARGGAGGQSSVGPVLVEADVELWRGAGGSDVGSLGGQAAAGATSPASPTPADAQLMHHCCLCCLNVRFSITWSDRQAARRPRTAVAIRNTTMRIMAGRIGCACRGGKFRGADKKMVRQSGLRASTRFYGWMDIGERQAPGEDSETLGRFSFPPAAPPPVPARPQGSSGSGGRTAAAPCSPLFLRQSAGSACGSSRK